MNIDNIIIELGNVVCTNRGATTIQRGIDILKVNNEEIEQLKADLKERDDIIKKCLKCCYSSTGKITKPTALALYKYVHKHNIREFIV